MVLEEEIKRKAQSLGFELVGIAPVIYSPENHDKLLKWLGSGYSADMKYMARAPRKRYDPRLFYKATKSIVVVGINYYKKPEYVSDQPYISIYARGKPYQDVIKNKLEELLSYIKEIEPSAKGKIAVDSSPTSDKLWAQLAGIGWQGKNTVVINRKIGSFIFLGELFLNLELEPDEPDTDHCAECTKCLEACPTGALEEPYLLNANKCISYLTVETKDVIDYPEMIGNHLFGCDICQLVCPYNKNTTETESPDLQAQYTQSPDFEHLVNLTRTEFEHRYNKTIIAEYGFDRVSRNTKIVLRNSNHLHNGA